MPRAHIYKTIQNGTGDLLANASVQVLEPNTDTLISEVLYNDSEGSGTFNNPFNVSNGVISFYLNAAKNVDIRVTTSLGTEVTFQDMLVLGVTQADEVVEDALIEAKAVFEANLPLPSGVEYSADELMTSVDSLPDSSFRIQHDARLASAIDVAIEDAVSGRVPGAEMGYAVFESATPWTTTNTDYTSVTAGASGGSAALIPGLAVSVVGDGGPVKVELSGVCDTIAADKSVIAYLVINKNSGGRAAFATGSNYGVSQIRVAGTQDTIKFMSRVVIPEGESWVFEVGVGVGTSGTARIFGYNASPYRSKTELLVTHL